MVQSMTIFGKKEFQYSFEWHCIGLKHVLLLAVCLSTMLLDTPYTVSKLFWSDLAFITDRSQIIMTWQSWHLPLNHHYVLVVCNPGPKCHVLTSASSPQCRGTTDGAFDGRGNFTFACQDLSRALIIKMFPQCWAYTWALQREKSISPQLPGPVRGRGYKWLMHNTRLVQSIARSSLRPATYLYTVVHVYPNSFS